MTTYSPAWPHSAIQSIFPNIFFVTGTNKTTFKGVEIQHSRNMIIVREDNNLTLINSVRLTNQGLQELESLGRIKNIIRIGAFHGRDDAFYKERYQADLWALKGMTDENNAKIDHVLTEGNLPLNNTSLFYFETSKFPEAVIYLKEHDGIIVSCDSIKNWVEADEYFSPKSAKQYAKQGLFGQATISSIWLQATETKKSDFDKILSLDFQHILSAHGTPLLNNAKSLLKMTMQSIYGSDVD